MNKSHFKKIIPIIVFLLCIAVIIINHTVKQKGLQGPQQTDKPESWPSLSDSNGKDFKKIDLRILYAGHPGSEREKDFSDFLSKSFTSVKTADLMSFNERWTDDVDVTILDYDGDAFKLKLPYISHNLDSPIVTLSVAGAFMCDRMQLKTGYL